MWHDHPFSQRNKTTERVAGVEVGGDREGGWTKFEKGVVGKMEGLRPVCQLIFLTAKYKRRYTENYLYKKRKIPLSID